MRQHILIFLFVMACLFVLDPSLSSAQNVSTPVNWDNVKTYVPGDVNETYVRAVNQAAANNDVAGMKTLTPAIDIADAVTILEHLFRQKELTIAQKAAADVNRDGAVNIADAVYILAYLFGSGPQPENFKINLTQEPYHTAYYTATGRIDLETEYLGTSVASDGTKLAVVRLAYAAESVLPGGCENNGWFDLIFYSFGTLPAELNAHPTGLDTHQHILQLRPNSILFVGPNYWRCWWTNERKLIANLIWQAIYYDGQTVWMARSSDPYGSITRLPSPKEGDKDISGSNLDSAAMMDVINTLREFFHMESPPGPETDPPTEGENAEPTDEETSTDSSPSCWQEVFQDWCAQESEHIRIVGASSTGGAIQVPNFVPASGAINGALREAAKYGGISIGGNGCTGPFAITTAAVHVDVLKVIGEACK